MKSIRITKIIVNLCKSDYINPITIYEHICKTLQYFGKSKGKKSTNISENPCRSIENQFRPTNFIGNKLKSLKKSQTNRKKEVGGRGEACK